jgi:hypothetical protein
MTAHHFRVTNRNDGSSFDHGPVYDHTPEAALALARLTFGPILWDVTPSTLEVECSALNVPSVPNPTLNQLSLF